MNYRGLDCCYEVVLSAVRIVQSTEQSYYNSVPTICWNFVLHPCQVQRWCHHLVHILFLRYTEVLSIAEDYCAYKRVNSVGIGGGISQCILSLVCLHISSCYST